MSGAGKFRVKLSHFVMFLPGPSFLLHATADFEHLRRFLTLHRSHVIFSPSPTYNGNEHILLSLADYGICTSPKTFSNWVVAIATDFCSFLRSFSSSPPTVRRSLGSEISNQRIVAFLIIHFAVSFFFFFCYPEKFSSSRLLMHSNNRSTNERKHMEREEIKHKRNDEHSTKGEEK